MAGIHMDNSPHQSQAALTNGGGQNNLVFTGQRTNNTAPQSHQAHSASSTPNNMTNNNANSNLSQIQSPSKYDEAERTRQRLELLRKHHNESANRYQRTQPIINERIKEETLKYLKSGQINGTKTKNPKPRAPKRQRTSTAAGAANTNGTSSNCTNSNGLGNLINTTGTTSPQVSMTHATNNNSLLTTNHAPNVQAGSNGLLVQQSIKSELHQPLNHDGNMIMTNQGPPMQQMATMYQAQPQLPPQQQPHQPMHPQQHAMHHQQSNMTQQQYKYQNANAVTYNQPQQQLNMQMNNNVNNTHQQYQQPQQHTIYRPQPPQQSPQLPPTSVPPAITHHQNSSIQPSAQMIPQQHQIEHSNHFVSSHQVRQQQPQQQQFNNNSASLQNNGHQPSLHQHHSTMQQQAHPQHMQPQQHHQYHSHHQQPTIHVTNKGNPNLPYTSLPNDLDLNLQAGLECDVDSLIKHEMSVEGQLDFNQDLLLRLDNPYTTYH